MDQIKKLKEQIFNSLKRRKELLVQMKDQTYIEESIEDLCKEIIYEEVDVTIEGLLGKNLTLHEEVKKLKREKEFHLVRMYEVIEQKKKAKDDMRLLSEKMEEKENEVQ